MGPAGGRPLRAKDRKAKIVARSGPIRDGYVKLDTSIHTFYTAVGVRPIRLFEFRLQYAYDLKLQSTIKIVSFRISNRKNTVTSSLLISIY